MKNILLTGATGFIGRNIKDYLSNICNLYTPNRNDLNLYDENEVRDYIKSRSIKIVIHCANPNPVKNSLDRADTMFEDSLRMFMNLYKANDLYDMMYTLGSGAEFDKSKEIVMVKEEEEFRSVPFDSYGLAKFVINQIASKSDKICNLRIFACYGPTDHESKFITHVINCCKRHEPITIRQDCYFDYMQVMDLAKIIEYFINNEPNYKSYNICTGKRYLLSDIAKIVKQKMNSDSDIVVLKNGLNNEYTGDNSRITEETGSRFMDLDDGIDIQIQSMCGE